MPSKASGDPVPGLHNASVVDREELAGEQQELLTRLLGGPVDSGRPDSGPPRPRPKRKRPAAREEPAPDPSGGRPERPSASAAVALLYQAQCPARRATAEMAGKGVYRSRIPRCSSTATWPSAWSGPRNWRRQCGPRCRGGPAALAASVQSEMLACEMQIAHDEAQKRHGKPRMLPVRINFEGELPSEMAVILDRFQYFLWRTPGQSALLAELLQTLQTPPGSQDDSPSRRRPAARFAVLRRSRPTDRGDQAAMRRQDSVILIRALARSAKRRCWPAASNRPARPAPASS